MNNRGVPPIVLALSLAVAVGACDTTRTVGPYNIHPTVISLSVFPGSIGPADSALVTCVATDADGDTLVYDWYSGGCNVVMQGARGEPYLFHQFDASLVVYPGPCASIADTAWVWCYVRDRKGGGAYAGLVRIVMEP